MRHMSTRAIMFLTGSPPRMPNLCRRSRMLKGFPLMREFSPCKRLRVYDSRRSHCSCKCAARCVNPVECCNNASTWARRIELYTRWTRDVSWIRSVPNILLYPILLLKRLHEQFVLNILARIMNAYYLVR